VKTIPEKYSCIVICILLAAVTFGVYWPVHSYEFIKYDDNTYITDNRLVQNGLSVRNVKWAFTTGTASNWHPVTWLSHMLDVELFGLNAGAHHLVNLFFHIINSLLLFLLIKRITSSLWAAALVAALFALHPLHIESVAWVAERKDVLSTFFAFLTILAWVRYTDCRKIFWYICAFILFAIGLMAKPMLVTLPFILLLLDYWPLDRLKFGARNTKDNNRQGTLLWKLLVEKIPFFILSAASSAVTFVAQRSGGAMSTMEVFSVKVRVFNSAISYFAYIEKMFWPVKLAVLYPHPGKNISSPKAVICIILLVVLTVLFLYLGRRKKYLTTGWLWYLGTLIPVIGLAQVGVQSMADRYTYIPYIGLFIIAAWALRDIVIKLPRLTYPIAITATMVLLLLSVATCSQLKYWVNSEALFEHTLAVTTGNYFMHNNYANILSDNGQNELAAEHYEKALKIRDRYPEIHNNYSNVLLALGRIDKAIAHGKRAIQLDPTLSAAHYNLGAALLKKGLTGQAIHEFELAVKTNPANADAHSILGFQFAKKGQLDLAIEHYAEALKYAPGDVLTHGRRGMALAQKGDIDSALDEFRYVVEKRPDDFEMHCNIGILLEHKGQTEQAIEYYKKALRIKSDYTDAQNRLNAILKKNN
jgi:tetratricopeptide (TPR) repeat protein